jgi:hypothetical protein
MKIVHPFNIIVYLVRDSVHSLCTFWLMCLNRCVVYKEKKVITCWEQCGSRDKNWLCYTWHGFGYTDFHSQGWFPHELATILTGTSVVRVYVLKPWNILFECLCWICYDSRQIGVWDCPIGERFLLIITVKKLINSGNLWPLYMMCLWYITLL